MNEVLAFLREHRLLSGLSDDDLAALAECGHFEAVASGTVLFKEGGSADRCYAMQAGRVALSFHASGRGDLVFETVGPGEMLGWSWLFPPRTWDCDARVVEDASFVVIDGPSVLARIGDDPRLGMALMERFAHVIYRRLRHAELRMLDLYGRAGG